MYDYNSQNFSQQIENTTYGVAVKRRDGIRKLTGEYIEKNSEYVFAKERDYGIYGKYGSDILFTENGLELRGGKLLSKDAANTRSRKKLISTPIYTNKQSKLHLKKYPKSASLVDLKRTLERTENVNLNYVIEYEIDSLSTPTKINIYAFKLINDLGGLYKTDNFNDNTPVSIIGDAPPLKLINLDNSLTGATHTIDIDPEANKTTLAKNIAIETYVPNRTAQISLANYTVLKIKIPGDPGITVGRTIQFNLLTLKPTTETKNLDEFYSGKYLVTAVRHIIQPTAFQTVLEIAKDSTPKPYGGINYDSDAWIQAVRA
jgi:hypothetical protein